MRSKIYWLIIILLSGAAGMVAQNANTNNFKLELTAPQYKSKMAYLLMYWNGDTYTQDSCIISDRGVGKIQIHKSLPGGQYLLYIKPDVQLELLLDDGQNDIKISIAEKIEDSKITGSRDTEILWQYIKGANALEENHIILSEQATDGTSDSERENIKSQVEEATLAFDSEIDKLIAANKGTWASVFLKGMKSVNVPHQEPQTREEYLENKTFVREHYFDNMDLTDHRLLRTNYFYSYLDNYMENWVEQDVVLIAEAASRIIGKTQGNQIVFESLLSRFMNNSMNSKLMGMENTWARLGEDYIFDNPAIRMDSTELLNLRSQYEIIKENRIGMQAHDLGMETLDGDSINLYDIDAEYLVLYFYNHTCGHCVRETKVINEEIYPKYKDRGLKIVSMNIYPERSAWQNFVEDQKIQNWYNCADPHHKSQYWMYYDTTAVPSLYLLDKNKKIIAKKIDEEGLKTIFDILYNENGSD